MKTQEQLLVDFKERLGLANITTSKAQTEFLYKTMKDFFQGIQREERRELMQAYTDPYDQRRIDGEIIVRAGENK